MYIPKPFHQTEASILHELIRQFPFGTLITSAANTLSANHIPFELEPHPEPHGLLLAHVARANPVWKDAAHLDEVLVIFQGPQHYISPSWYPSKKEAGKAVPTWNYVALHVYGKMRALEDPIWLKNLLQRLSYRYEQGRPEPWSIEEAPASYIEALMAAIVGIEIQITRMEGKWKLGQNRSLQDQQGILAGLSQENTPQARQMLDFMQNTV